MGRRLDALLGRNFKTSKFTTLAKLAISRVAIFQNQHQARYSHARSDVFDLLKLGHQENALLRVEHVIRERNMLDVFSMIENYCQLLIERVTLIEKNKECPDELKEATSSLIFASSRCGEFPELLHIRGVLSSRFGKEFASQAIELRNHCSVNPKMIQKLSTKQASLENRLKALREIAFENGITIQLEHGHPVASAVEFSVTMQEKTFVNEKQEQPDQHNNAHNLTEDLNLDEKLSESVRARKKYRDVAAAAQEAFESAAYAAAAARAAVELSRTGSQDNAPDDQSGSSHRKRTIYDSDSSSTPKLQNHGHEVSEWMKQSNNVLASETIHPVDNYSSESEGEDLTQTQNAFNLERVGESKNKTRIESVSSASSSDSEGEIPSEKKLSSNLSIRSEPFDYQMAFDRANDETEKKRRGKKFVK